MKKLTDILTEVKYTKPNFDFEWEEAIRYPEFKEMGKKIWKKIAGQGYTTKYSKIKDKLGNVDLNFDGLEEPKKQRFQTAYKNGTIEIPIVVKFSNDDYDLVAGNTRLSGLVNNNEDPSLWIVDISNLHEQILERSMIAGIHDKKETLVLLRDMLKKYGVPNTKIQWASYTDKYAHYDFHNDVIYISTAMNKDNKEFLITVCHELKHAMDRKKLGGGDEYQDAYELEQNMQIYRNKHPYKNNRYEIAAERFGQREWKKWSKRIGKIGVRK